MTRYKVVIYLLAILLFFACSKINNPQYHVDDSACVECGKCILVCPRDAVEFGVNGKAVIDQTKCNQCGKCIAVCPQDAIF